MSVTTMVHCAPILLSNLLHNMFPLLSCPSFSTRPLLLQPCHQCPTQRPSAGKPLASKLHTTTFLCSLPLRLMWFCRQRRAHWHKRVVLPTAGTQAQTLRVGVVAYQYSVAELVAAAPSIAINARSLEGQARKKIAGLLSQYCCHYCTRVRVK